MSERETSRRRWALFETQDQENSMVAYVVGFMGIGFAALWVLTRVVLAFLVKGSDEVRAAVLDVQKATVAVEAEVARLARETARTQRLAIWVGVGTAVLGAIVGGFAGAFAAKVIG